MWRISSPKPKLQSNNSSLIHYLVCVPEFTDLSGNQVSLVILHLHGIDILLTQRRERQKEKNTKYSVVNIKKLQITQHLNYANNTSSFFSFRFLLRGWLSGSCEGALSSLAYSRMRTSIAPFTTWSRRRVSSSRTSSSSSSPFFDPPLAPYMLQTEKLQTYKLGLSIDSNI